MSVWNLFGLLSKPETQEIIEPINYKQVFKELEPLRMALLNLPASAKNQVFTETAYDQQSRMLYSLYYFPKRDESEGRARDYQTCDDPTPLDPVIEVTIQDDIIYVEPKDRRELTDPSSFTPYDYVGEAKGRLSTQDIIEHILDWAKRVAPDRHAEIDVIAKGLNSQKQTAPQKPLSKLGCK